MSTHDAAEAAEGLGRAARGAALNLIGAVVATAAGFGAIAVVTNRYGPAGAGVFLAAIAVFTLVANALKLGTESALTYLIARLRRSEKRSTVAPVLRSAVSAVFVANAAAGVVLVVTAGPLANLLADEADLVEDLTTMLRILAVGLPTWSLLQVFGGAARGFATMKPWVVAGQIVRPSVQLALVVVAAITTDELWPLAAAWVAGTAVALALLVVWLRGFTAGLDGADPADVAAARSELWAFSRPRALSDVVHSALERLDVVLVSTIVGPAAAGLYGAANRMILAGQMVMVATGQAAAPELSDSFGRDDHDGARDTIRGLTSWNITLLWPAFGLLIAGAPALLPLLGEDFIEAESSLIVLAVAMIVVIALGVGDVAVLMAGAPGRSLVNHIVALATMLVLAFALLPTVGVIGAAWAWAGSRFALRGLSVHTVWRRTGVTPFGPEVAVAGVVAIAIWLPVGVGLRMVDPASLIMVAIAGVIGAGAHAAVAYRLRRRLRLDELLDSIRNRRGAKATT